MSDSALPDGQGFRPEQEQGAVESTGSVIAAVAANILVGIVKFIAAAISGSSAMVSEGIHSIVDSGNGLLILLGIKKSSRKPDVEHPFGYGQELYFWTLVVAIMIFALGGGVSIYEGISRIREVGPDTVLGDPAVNYVVLLVAAAIEGSSLFIALRNFYKARGNVRPAQFIREAKDPSLFTVVLEDSAAELGLLFAFLGVFLSHLFNNPYLDGAASVLVGLLLASVSVILLRETKGLLIGEGLKASELRDLEALVESDSRVVECGRILTYYMGPHDMLMNMDVTFSEKLDRDQVTDAIDDIEGAIVAHYPQTTKIFIESESYRFTHAQSLRGAQMNVSVPHVPPSPEEGR